MVIESNMYYESRLESFDVTLNTSTSVFQCKSTVNNKVVSKEISFQIKGKLFSNQQRILPCRFIFIFI